MGSTNGVSIGQIPNPVPPSLVGSLLGPTEEPLINRLPAVQRGPVSSFEHGYASVHRADRAASSCYSRR